jgi:hypothetical protein
VPAYSCAADEIPIGVAAVALPDSCCAGRHRADEAHRPTERNRAKTSELICRGRGRESATETNGRRKMAKNKESRENKNVERRGLEGDLSAVPMRAVSNRVWQLENMAELDPNI